jgi:hypothetical protein
MDSFVTLRDGRRLATVLNEATGVHTVKLVVGPADDTISLFTADVLSQQIGVVYNPLDGLYYMVGGT